MHHNLRICRPVFLNNKKRKILIDYLIKKVGSKYDLKNIVSVVNSKENISLFNAYGITELFFQGRSILELIINSSGITLPISLLDIRNKGTSLWSIKIPKESNAIGMDLSKYKLDKD